MVPVHFGGMSDPLQAIETREKLGLRTLEMLRDYEYPTILSTKSDLLLRNDYINVLKRMKIAVQISLITSDEKIAKRLEPNAPSVRRRLEVIAKLSDSGIWASCRLQPLIPHVNTDDFELIDELSDAGCRHVIIEHYKFPTYACTSRKTHFRRVCSYDVLKYYREKGAHHSKVFLELPSSVKIENLSRLVPRIHARKMTYGAADNDLHHLGDDVCCCGVGKLSGFETVYKHTFTKAVFDARVSGAIEYSSIDDEWSPRGTVRRILDGECRLSSASSVRDFVKMKWNMPYTRNSPTDLFGVRPSGRYDRDGNIVYECQPHTVLM
jgi:hypothetical protein